MVPLSPFHRAEANIRWIGLKINRLSTVWLIHSLSGVITVPSTTMSQARRGEDALEPTLGDEWSDSSKWREYAKTCAESHVCQSAERMPERCHSQAVAMGPLDNQTYPIINRHLWRGLALTLSNYHASLWWSIWAKSFRRASWHPVSPDPLICWERNRSRVGAELWPGLRPEAAQSSKLGAEIRGSFDSKEIPCWCLWTPLAKCTSALPGVLTEERGSGFMSTAVQTGK